MISCQNLSLGRGSKIILQGLSFSVNDGAFLSIIGENGAGKSTLIKALLGLLPPLSGKICMPEGAGYLPQQSEGQKDFPASVREVVLSGCLGRLGWRAFFSGQDKASAREAMNSMKILDLAGKSYRELSGGQRQRVLLARALCAAKNALVLDEPVSGLDPQAASSMYELVSSLNDKGITIIMVSHDLEAAIQYSSHILSLTRGGIFFGTKEEFLRHD